MTATKTKQEDRMDVIAHCLNVAARAENAKGYVLQAEHATEDGARFLRGQAREALGDVIQEATAALALLDADTSAVEPTP